jgi:hypothetical protein
MSRNRTNRQRAARELAAATGITYMQALAQLANTTTRTPTPAADSDSGDVAAIMDGRWALTLNDSIGHTSDTVDTCDLWPDMVAAFHTNPDAGTWTGTTDDTTWTFTRTNVIWADDDGDFLLHGGTFGNPGCDECGSDDAVVKHDGTYLCATAATTRHLTRPTN